MKVSLIAAASTLALAAGSTLAVAAASGAWGRGNHAGFSALGESASTSCSAPALPGSLVDVQLTDMGAWMGGGMMRGGYGPMGGGGYAPAAMMNVQVSPSTVPAGTVSLRVANLGAMTHELVVLPLSGTAQPGQRPVGTNGKVSETGSLGEASNTCAAGAGDGIVSGASSWVTLDLAPGRYELVCNLPGHYAAGMYAELDVTA